MHFLSLIAKNLARRSFRSFLTLIALSTAIGCVVALLGIANGFMKSFSDVYAAHRVDVVVSRQGAADRLSSSIDCEFVEKIQGLNEVKKAAAVLLETLSFEEQGVFGIPTMGIEPGSWVLEDYRLRNGASLQGSAERELLLGVHLADRMKLQAGDDVAIFDEKFKVRGVFESLSAWENGSLILPMAQLQELTDRLGQATYINVILETEHAVSSKDSIASIEALDPKLLALATKDFVESDSRMKLAGAMAWMTSGIALIIGAIGTLNTMMMSVFERTREIGILRAIGWPKRRIIAMILLESAGLAIVGCMFGCLLAISLTWGLSRVQATNGVLRPSIDWPIFAEGWLLAIGIGLLGAWLPAWRAAQMQPTSAFREI